MGEGRQDLVVYVIRQGRRIIYVGQGTPLRVKFWGYPSRYRTLGITEKPYIDVLASGLDRPAAIKIEAEYIRKLKPEKNKSKYGSTGGLVPHNKGRKGGKGGRPKGIPTSEETKRKLSEALKGKASAWMSGKEPWNKGLTAETDTRVAKGLENYGPGKRSQAASKTWSKRRSNNGFETCPENDGDLRPRPDGL